MTGTLYGVGLGPGDPELVTIKAARLISAADVVAYHCARHGNSIARSIAQQYLRAGQAQEQLVYPVTTEGTNHPGGYAGAMEEFYTSSAQRLAAHLEAGRDVVVLAEGDPLFFSSYMHLHKRLTGRFTTVVVPGVTSVSAAAAAVAIPLVEADEVLTVMPGSLPPDILAERLAGTDAAAIMKIGSNYPAVLDALARSGRLACAQYVERASHEHQRLASAADVDPATVPYMSLVLVPGRTAASRPAEAEPSGARLNPAMEDPRGEVVVVGLGPGPRDWVTPEAQAELAAAEHVVGYSTYVERVPLNPRQQRHASDNMVEAERAEFALDLARRGARVAVVSSGDPGVFAMASAVLEVADSGNHADVEIRIVPGLTAAQAVASRAGAPLGHDFCVLSLSDRLKPWSIVAERLLAAAAADLVIAIYNPASRVRRHQVATARDLLLQHRKPETPVVIGRAVGSPSESVTVVTLGDLDPDVVDMQTLLIVGSSQTRFSQRQVTRSGHDHPMVYTPRSYPKS